MEYMHLIFCASNITYGFGGAMRKPSNIAMPVHSNHGYKKWLRMVNTG